MPPLSIIIVTYKPGDIFRACLQSLRASEDIEFELIVVDNNSQDETLATAREFFPEAALIANQDNRGFASANNQGLAIAQGKYQLLLNPDVILEPQTLHTLIAFMDEHPSIGIAAPRVLTPEGKVALTAYAPLNAFRIAWRFLAIDYLFPYIVHGRYRAQCERAETPFEPAWVSGCCFLIRREVYEQIGGLDEGLFLFNEEPDYCDRALIAGWRTAYVPMTQVVHSESSSISRYPLVKIRAHHISPLYYFRKRRRKGTVIALKFIFTLELALKALFRTVQGVIRRDEVALRAAKARGVVLMEVWRY